MNVNLQEKPYYLQDDDIAWVHETINSMSLEEKVGQLFIILGKSSDEQYVKEMVETYHLGGARFIETDPQKILRQNRAYQKYSKVPMFIAANCEDGGKSVCQGGTLAATQVQCGADRSTCSAYEMGQIGSAEAAAVGCNWTFSPIVDILYNWRNTIVGCRSFGSDPERVLELARANIAGVKESNIMSCAKHFPGDGVDERDQHLVLSMNSLAAEEWMSSFGTVYRELIDDGLESIMIGHIGFPEYSRMLHPDLTDEQILPATMDADIVTGLLRQKLGFQGLVVTDASHMAGLLCAGPRSRQVPGTIAAGCDMFLFFHDEKEDFQYMLEGVRSGVITEQRLEEALTHILGMKAKLGLHKKVFQAEAEDETMLQIIGGEVHRQIAGDIADRTVTLVKDSQHLLPVSAAERKRAMLYYIESAPVSLSDGLDPARQIVVEELEQSGFDVTVNKSFYEYEQELSSPLNKFKVMQMPAVEEFKRNYDIVFVFVNMKGYAQENNVRLKYSAPHSNELPWWICEVPTVCVSLSYTNLLYDMPMMKTYINAYAPSRECIRAAIEKITGRSEFKGIYNENVWGDTWDTKC